MRDGKIDTVNYPEGSIIDVKPMSQGDPVIQKAIAITQEMFQHECKYCFTHLSQAMNEIIIQASQTIPCDPIII